MKKNKDKRKIILYGQINIHGIMLNVPWYEGETEDEFRDRLNNLKEKAYKNLTKEDLAMVERWKRSNHELDQNSKEMLDSNNKADT